MIIKNEYVKIKNGKKETTLHNYIYDDYLALYSTTQYDVDESDVDNLLYKQGQKKMTECYVKFDTPIADITNATTSDFEVLIYVNRQDFLGLQNGANVTYEYDFENGIDLDTMEQIDKSDYYGKKITALGFGNLGLGNIASCLDISNYEIYVLEDEGLYITRKDVITSEARCPDYEFPVHLSPIGDVKNAVYNSTSGLYEPKYAKIYSVGLSKTIGVEDEEYIIGEDIDIKVIDDTKFSFNLLKGENETIYPRTTLYAGTDIYPLPPYVDEELYPSNNIFPNFDVFPKDSNYKYIFYKFRLYLIHWNGIDPNTGSYEIQWLNQYYTMYLKNTTAGLFEIITKIERSEE